MTFGLSGAALAGIAVGGATLISANQQSKAAKSAAQTQAQAAVEGSEASLRASELAIEEQRRQFDKVQELLRPYSQAGEAALEGLSPFAAAGAPALQAQQAFLGLQGPEAEQAAIDRITGGSTFQELTRQGEEAILSRASATGGLRGGNVQAALAQFRPALLSSLIDQQYSRLGGMTALGAETTGNLARLGQASAAGTGAAAQTTGTAVSNLLAQQGAAMAGGQLAAGRAAAAIPSAISGGLGIFSGLGGKF
jgi:hypothetical protein